jgi:hypothetical protein
MKKIKDYKKTLPLGVIGAMAIEFENKGEKFAVTMDEYLTNLEECESYKRLGYVYVY